MLKYEARTDNCLQCCIAGMFDLKLEQVPTVQTWAKSGYWFGGMLDYCTGELKHYPAVIEDDTLDNVFHIAVGETKKGVCHAVIARGMDVIWDPNPNVEEKMTVLNDYDYSVVFINMTGCSIQNSCNITYMNDLKEIHG